MFYNIEEISLKNSKEVEEVKNFLKKFNLELDNNIDYTIVIRVNGEIAATCSKAENVFKCFAVNKELQGEGITNKLITSLNDKLFEEGIYHSFIFTKPENTAIFKSSGYKVVYEVENASLLENGIYDINKYLDKIIKKYSLESNIKRSALVMNCNPFTLGHKYVIEKAAEESEEVLVFIVEEDKSLFPFKYRYEIVKKGIEHLSNVKVIPGGEYIISQATFPSYFLRKENDILEAYTRLDAGIFAKYFCNKLMINKRYVGEEPYCKVTNAYNKALYEKLNEYGIELKIIERKKIDDEVISASKVRKLIKEEMIQDAKELIPKVTWEFLNTIEGKEIMENIKSSDSPH